MSFLPHASAQNFQSEQFDCAREFAFRKSAGTLYAPDVGWELDQTGQKECWQKYEVSTYYEFVTNRTISLLFHHVLIHHLFTLRSAFFQLMLTKQMFQPTATALPVQC